MVKVFNEVRLSYSCVTYLNFCFMQLDQDDHYEDELLSIADPLNQVSLFCFFPTCFTNLLMYLLTIMVATDR